MKRFFILVLALVLPLQPLFAATAGFAHFLGSQSTEEKTISHMVEHLNLLAHHHESNGDAHEDESQQSNNHLVDFEHGFNLTLLLVARTELIISQLSGEIPQYFDSGYLNPTTSPPLKPPYLAL